MKKHGVAYGIAMVEDILETREEIGLLYPTYESKYCFDLFMFYCGLGAEAEAREQLERSLK